MEGSEYILIDVKLPHPPSFEYNQPIPQIPPIITNTNHIHVNPIFSLNSNNHPPIPPFPILSLHQINNASNNFNAQSDNTATGILYIF